MYVVYLGVWLGFITSVIPMNLVQENQDCGMQSVQSTTLKLVPSLLLSLHPLPRSLSSSRILTQVSTPDPVIRKSGSPQIFLRKQFQSCLIFLVFISFTPGHPQMLTFGF